MEVWSLEGRRYGKFKHLEETENVKATEFKEVVAFYETCASYTETWKGESFIWIYETNVKWLEGGITELVNIN
jgi:hypothetical protein